MRSICKPNTNKERGTKELRWMSKQYPHSMRSLDCFLSSSLLVTSLEEEEEEEEVPQQVGGGSHHSSVATANPDPIQSASTVQRRARRNPVTPSLNHRV